MGDIFKLQYPSPCSTCDKVPDPQACENKECRPWRQWFMYRWALIHAWGCYHLKQSDLQSADETADSKVRTSQDQSRSYLSKDPCDGCICPKDLCATPCRDKRIWQQRREGVFL